MMDKFSQEEIKENCFGYFTNCFFFHDKDIKRAIKKLARSEKTRFFGMLSADELEKELGL